MRDEHFSVQAETQTCFSQDEISRESRTLAIYMYSILGQLIHDNELQADICYAFSV